MTVVASRYERKKNILPHRPDIHVTERVRDDLDAAARSTGLPTFEGTPEA